MNSPAQEISLMVNENGWTQKELAGKFGVSAQYISDVIRGNRKPGKKILDGLNMEKVVIYRYKEASDDDAT